jgi:hypothetical protein
MSDCLFVLLEYLSVGAYTQVPCVEYRDQPYTISITNVAMLTMELHRCLFSIFSSFVTLKLEYWIIQSQMCPLSVRMPFVAIFLEICNCTSTLRAIATLALRDVAFGIAAT